MAVAIAPDIAARLPQGFQAFLDQLVAQFDPERVILFGSRARGEATEESDTDVLVVMDLGELTPLKASHAIRRAIRPLFPMDFVVMRPAEFEERQAGLRYEFIPIVMREGLMLYARL